MLNSKIIKWYFTHCLGTTSGVGTNRWLKYTIEQLPLICSLEPDFENMIKQMISQPAKELDAKINNSLYDSYDLSEEEIAYIESII